VAWNVRSSNSLDSAGSILVRVDDRDIGRSSECVSLSVPVLLQSALYLVMKTTSKNELCMQVGRRQGIAEENEFFRRA
jgi:hypothetical protein